MDNRAVQYARFCLEEQEGMVPKYVKLQAKDWLNILAGKDSEAFVDEAEAEKVMKLLELMQHPDLGCPMSEGMEDYALFLAMAVFSTKLRADNTRFYQTAVLYISRKNFKTFNSAVIFILLMLMEKRFSRFFSVAPDLKLSKELQVAIKKIIKSSPVLVDRFKILRSEIRCEITESEYTPLAYSEDKMDGKLAHAYLADEAGAMDSYPVEAMRSSQITLANKLGIIISTQYPNDNNAMIDEVDIAKKTLDGLMANRRRFALLYEPDDKYLSGDQWQTEDRIIYQSNPAAVSNRNIFDAIVALRDMAVLYENKRENYLCKHNNIKYKGLGVEGYVDIAKVRECKVQREDGWWRGKRAYVGLDLSLSDDNCAIAMMAEDGGKIRLKTVAFIPAGRLLAKTKKENVDYGRMVRDGYCISCGDEIVDYSVIEELAINLQKTYGLASIQVGYDRWNAISTVQKLEAAGIDCVEIKQHSSVLSMPTKRLKEAILTRELEYEANLLLEINFQNARCTKDTNLNEYVNKKKSAGKVDMVVATINAMYLLQQDMLYGSMGFVVQVV